MKLIGMMACRNERWVVGLSARVALGWCDALVLLDHRSTDDSPAIIDRLEEEYPGRVIRLHESSTEWDEMTMRQQMLAAARKEGATHLAIIDADEVLTGNLTGIRNAIENMPRGYILQLPGYNLRDSIHRYHANGIWGDRWFSVAFADHPNLHWGGDQFHHREPMGMTLGMLRAVAQGQGGVMHLWGASERRLRAKHALYKMTETLRWRNKSRHEINTLYTLAFDPSLNRRFDQNWQYAAVPTGWWEPYQSLMEHLAIDAVPWQEEECRRLLSLHGAERFAGLDLFDVVKERVHE